MNNMAEIEEILEFSYEEFEFEELDIEELDRLEREYLKAQDADNDNHSIEF